MGFSKKLFRHREAAKIVSIYILFGFSWIYLSDTIVGWLVHDEKIITIISILKGLFFIVFTSCLLFFLIVRLQNKINQSTNKLRESEKKFRFLVKNSSDSLVIVNADGSQKYVSPASERITGFSISELEGKTLDSIIHPDDIANVMAAWDEVLTNPKNVITVQYRHIHKTDGWVYSEAIAQSFLNEPAINGVIASVRDITKQKKSEEEFRNLYDEAPIGYFEYDLQGNITRVNHTHLKMLGYTAEEMIGQPCWKFIVDIKAREQIMAKLGGARPPAVALERTYRRKDGTTFPGVFQDRLMFDEDGNIKGIRTAIQNITERKQAEEAQLESEKQISSIFRSAPVGIGSVVNRVLSKVNSRLCEMTGYEETDLIGQSSQMLYPSDEEFEFVGREKYAQIAEHGTGTVETHWQKKDGTIIDVLLSSSPVDLQDQSKGVTFTALDITERKRAEMALQESEERFRTIMDNIDTIAVQGYGPDGTTQYWNATSERLYGYSQQEAVGRNLLDLIIPPEMKAAVVKEMSEMAESSQPIPSGELLLMHKDGSRVPVLSHHAIVKVPGRAQEFFCLDVDISARIQAETEQEKLKTQLNQAQKMESIGRLAGGIAHDFNNMLGVILGHAEMALEETDPASPLYAYLHSIHQAGERSANLTRQLLAFARKQTIAPKVIDINDTVEGMLNMLRRLIGEDIDLLWQPGRNLQPVKIDPSQIDQLLANLCVNARDAIDGVGKITIETEAKTFDEDYCHDHLGALPGEYVLIEVSDDGCGMDKKTLSQVFEPFFTTKEQGQGTGLGLASTYGIIKQNKGFIYVYSELDQGTTFKIHLPVSGANSAEVSEKTNDLSADLGNETILLVEDESVILEMTTMMLERLGFKVLAAATPGEAIRLAHEYQGQVDLLITDVVMPEMNGQELAGILLSHYPDLKRLFMSGYTANVIAHHGVLDEGVHFIQKPFSKKDLGGKLREVLEG